jgi:SAM-dependent methyltransferase
MLSNSSSVPTSDPIGSDTLETIGEAGVFNKWMYSAIATHLHGRVLEIGSGLGNISTYLLEDKQKVVLSDLRQEYCDYLSDHFGNCKSLEAVIRIDIAHKDFEKTYGSLAGSFDSLFALNVIEHIEDPLTAIRNCGTLLKKNGTMVILVPSYQWLYCRFDRELGHFRRYNRKSLKELTEKNGFVTEYIFSFNAAGIAGWLLFGKILNRRQIKEGQMKLYDKFVSLFRLLDKVLFHKTGLSQIIIARK